VEFMKEVVPGIWSWSVFSETKRMDFNGFFIVGSSGNVLVDPPALRVEEQEGIKELGVPGAILLTNKDHVRTARECRSLFRADIGIHEMDAPFLEFRPDFQFRDGDCLPGSLVAVHIPDNKSPGETAFLHSAGGGALILGDAVIGRPGGDLSLLPAEKYADVDRAHAGLHKLLDHPFASVLMGDGPLTPVRGRSALERFLDRG